MKNIKIFCIHPCTNNLESFIKHFDFKPLTDSFNFQWSEDAPDYLIATEHIYKNKKLNQVFKKLYSKAKIKILCAEEAMACDWNIFDYGAGFDANLYFEDRYTQLLPPFLFFKNFVFEPQNNITTIDQAQSLLSEKKKFCNFLYSNANAHPIRDQIFHHISKQYKKVDSLGKHLNNTGVKGTGYVGHIRDCVTLKQPYKFSIACENAYYKGYTTEKILTSLQAHTIPIYFGNPLIGCDINPKSFINYHDFNNLEDMLDFIKKVDESDELWCKMIVEPWQTPEIMKHAKEREKKYYNFWTNLFEQDFVKAKRLPEGTYINIYQDWLFNHKYQVGNSLQKVIKKLSSLR